VVILFDGGYNHKSMADYINKTKQNAPTVGLLIITGIFAYSTARQLRSNNERAGELYIAVQKADQEGVGVSTALQELQVYVTGHMNASPLPQLGDNAPVQLQKSFERAKATESARATADRERVTAEAIAACESQFRSASLVARTECVANYQPATPALAERETVADIYRYDFVSPVWTPDVSGWLVVATIISTVALTAHILLRLVSRYVLSSRL
jgi:hypothetical protein